MNPGKIVLVFLRVTSCTSWLTLFEPETTKDTKVHEEKRKYSGIPNFKIGLEWAAWSYASITLSVTVHEDRRPSTRSPAEQEIILPGRQRSARKHQESALSR